MKDYVLTIGIDKFYLSQGEADFYLAAVDQGVKYVQIGDLTLGINFQSLAHKEALAGKVRCKAGNWHTNKAECFCNGEWITEGGVSRFVETKVEKASRNA